MKKSAWFFLPALLLLGSCTTTYTHPTKSASHFEQDRGACERTAKKALAAKGVT
jgi:hypothetical protein